MTDESPRVSVEDEARQIFEAARLNLAGESPVLPPTPPASLTGSDGGHNLPETTDEQAGLWAVLPGVPEDETKPVRDAPLAESDLGDDRYAVLGRGTPPESSRPEPATDERLKESRRDAFKRLQSKAEESRRSGFFE